MPLIGYARISTSDQNDALQFDALAAANCERTFKDRASGARDDRPGLMEALAYLRSGDTFVVWKLDRLGRSLSHLVKTIGELEAQNIGFQSLTEAIDTTTPSGRLTFHLFAALGQFERDLIVERTSAGLKAAVARGRKGGRKPVITPEILARAKILIAKDLSVREAATRLKISKSALYNALKAGKQPST